MDPMSTTTILLAFLAGAHALAFILFGLAKDRVGQTLAALGYMAAVVGLLI